MRTLFGLVALLLAPVVAMAAEGQAAAMVDLTGSVYGYLGVFIFVAAYALVPLENKIHLRKSKPVLMAAGIIWVLIAVAYIGIGDTHSAHEAIKASLLEYAELFLFLLAAMTYINAMEERNVFQSLRAWLVSRGFSLRTLFWITGALAFCISPVADNLTTALLMGAVVMAVGGDDKKFVALACINIVVAANAGGAFSPFGDITTLMVWQKGKVAFHEFFDIFPPSAVNWLVPAMAMSLAVGRTPPKKLEESVQMKYGAWGIMTLFLLTITTAVCFHNFLHLPPVAGMMLGLGFLGAFSYHIKRHEGRSERYDYILGARGDEVDVPAGHHRQEQKTAGADHRRTVLGRVRHRQRSSHHPLEQSHGEADRGAGGRGHRYQPALVPILQGTAAGAGRPDPQLHARPGGRTPLPGRVPQEPVHRGRPTMPRAFSAPWGQPAS